MSRLGTVAVIIGLSCVIAIAGFAAPGRGEVSAFFIVAVAGVGAFFLIWSYMKHRNARAQHWVLRKQENERAQRREHVDRLLQAMESQRVRRREQEARLLLEREEMQAQRRMINELIQSHIDTLRRKRIIKVHRDEYGSVNTTAWRNEVQYFYEKVVRPSVSSSGNLWYPPELVAVWVDNALDEYVLHGEHQQVDDASLSPQDFEALCAAILRDEGWKAHVTGGSGDQGVDVLAEKGGTKLVLQCKLHSGPVSNRAVQEVIAGRLFYGAGYAAVVSNASYTPSAQELARLSGVLLLHHADLGRVAKTLPGTS